MLSASAPPSIRRARSSGCVSGVSLRPPRTAPPPIPAHRGAVASAAASSIACAASPSSGPQAARQVASPLLRVTGDRREPSMQRLAVGCRSAIRRSRRPAGDARTAAGRHPSRRTPALLGLDQRGVDVDVRSESSVQRLGARARERCRGRRHGSVPAARGGPRGRAGARAVMAAQGVDHQGPAACAPGPSPPRSRARRTDCRSTPPRRGRAVGRGSWRLEPGRMSSCRAASDSGPRTSRSTSPGAKRALEVDRRASSPRRCDSRRPSRPGAAVVGRRTRWRARGRVEPLRVVDRRSRADRERRDRHGGQERAGRRARVRRSRRPPEAAAPLRGPPAAVVAARRAPRRTAARRGR